MQLNTRVSNLEEARAGYLLLLRVRTWPASMPAWAASARTSCCRR
jgi:hypothetical protein